MTERWLDWNADEDGDPSEQYEQCGVCGEIAVTTVFVDDEPAKACSECGTLVQDETGEQIQAIVKPLQPSKSSGFIQTKWVFELSKQPLSRTAKTTALALALFMDNKTGICWPSNKSLCHVTGASERTIIRGLRELEAEGWVESTRRWNNSSIRKAVLR